MTTPFQKILNQVIAEDKQAQEALSLTSNKQIIDSEKLENISNLPSQNTNYTPTVMLKRKPF